MQRTAAPLILPLLSLTLLTACDRSPDPAGASQQQPPPPVTVAHPVRREVIEWDDYNGRLAAVESVEVRARISGYLQSVHFQEGALVKKDEELFVIDPQPFQAEVDRAAGELKRGEAQHEYDAGELKRIDELRRSGAVSPKEYHDALLAERRSAAALLGAGAALRLAQLNLGYTNVTAPISGRIGRRLVTPGNLVAGGATQSTLLTTIVSIDPIYCYVDADERSVLKYQRLAREQRRTSARDVRIPCWLGLSDEQGFPHEGVIDFVNNALDPNTGTLTARGVFVNPNGYLTPGLFARLRVPGSGRYEALLIPDEAVMTDQSQRFVFVVGDDNIARYRRIEPGPLFEAMRVVAGGLGDSDRVVINGQMRIRDAMPVAPRQVEMPVKRGTGAGSPATQALPATRRIEPDSPTPQPATEEGSGFRGQAVNPSTQMLPAPAKPEGPPPTTQVTGGP